MTYVNADQRQRWCWRDVSHTHDIIICARANVGQCMPCHLKLDKLNPVSPVTVNALVHHQKYNEKMKIHRNICVYSGCFKTENSLTLL